MRIIAFIVLIGLPGCAEIPYENLDNASKMKLGALVKHYKPEELRDLKYKSLGPIEGTSCRVNHSDPHASREDAIDQLLYRSASLGGNGIARVICGERVDTSLSSANCWDSVKCNAVAIQVELTRHGNDFTSSSDSNPAQIIEELKKGVVKITAQVEEKNRVGTGFIVRLEKDAAYILTASHVVEGDAQPQVVFLSKPTRPLPARVLGLEGGNPRGLAALLVEGDLPSGLEALPLNPDFEGIGGEPITVIGFPRVPAVPWAVTPGAMTGQEGQNLIFSGAAVEGNSGGPIVAAGKVVGVVTEVAGQYGYAVPVPIARVVLRGWGVPLGGTSKETVRPVPKAPISR